MKFKSQNVLELMYNNLLCYLLVTLDCLSLVWPWDWIQMQSIPLWQTLVVIVGSVSNTTLIVGHSIRLIQWHIIPNWLTLVSTVVFGSWVSQVSMQAAGLRLSTSVNAGLWRPTSELHWPIVHDHPWLNTRGLCFRGEESGLEQG